jgi:hypothetical protein
MDGAVGNVQGSGHLYILTVILPSSLLIIQVVALSGILVYQQGVLPVLGFYDLTGKSFGLLLVWLLLVPLLSAGGLTILGLRTQCRGELGKDEGKSKYHESSPKRVLFHLILLDRWSFPQAASSKTVAKAWLGSPESLERRTYNGGV